MTNIKSEMIRAMKILKEVKAKLDEAEENAKILRQQIDEDLDPARQAVKDTRANVESMLREEFNGETFKVPGLGTAFFSTRRSTKIADEEKFRVYLEGNLDAHHFSNIFPRRMATNEAKQFAEEELDVSGELLPGIETEEVQSLTIRFK